MHKNYFSLALCALLVAFSFSAEAQQPTKILRIGYLAGASPSSNVARAETFRQGLRELGYVEGKNIIIEWRFAEEKLDRLPALAAELVRLKVDVIVTAGSIPTRSAKGATSTIPIVMTQDSDPVGNGFVASLARPGGNITGLSTLSPELSGKRLPKRPHACRFTGRATDQVRVCDQSQSGEANRPDDPAERAGESG